MPARDLPETTTQHGLHDAATARAQIRIRGVVVAQGPGRSGKYHNIWLHVQLHDGGLVRVTAGTAGALGQLPVGTLVELATHLDGILDVAAGNIYHGERTQLLQ